MTVTCRHCGETLVLSGLLEPEAGQFAPALVDHLKVAHPLLGDDLGHVAVVVGICFVLSQYVAEDSEFQAAMMAFRAELTKLLEDLDNACIATPGLPNP